MRTRFLLAASLALVAGGLVWLAALALWPDPDPEHALLRPADAELVSRGGEVYAAACASCHGENLEGEGDWRRRDADGYLPAPPHDETGHTWHHPDRMLFEMTKSGMEPFAGADYPSNMPAFDGVLSDDEIVAVLSYIKSRWPEPIRRRHDTINEAARDRP
jgi:S-disulfanyl-L-cysteine oxidoreductase SoxD